MHAYPFGSTVSNSLCRNLLLQLSYLSTVLGWTTFAELCHNKCDEVVVINNTTGGQDAAMLKNGTIHCPFLSFLSRRIRTQDNLSVFGQS
jgi:hypothetical protein